MPKPNKSNHSSEDLLNSLAEHQYNTNRLDQRFKELQQQLQQAGQGESAGHASAATTNPPAVARFPWWRWSVAASAIAAMLLFSLNILDRQTEVIDATEMPWTLETVETLWEIEDQLQVIAALLDSNTRADFLFLTPELHHE